MTYRITGVALALLATYAASACSATPAEERGAGAAGGRYVEGPTATGSPFDGGPALEDAAASRDLHDGAAPSLVPPAPIGAGALTDIDGLPFLRLDERSRHASSYDRSGGNVDFGNAYGVDADGNWIVLDTRGPGCVYRMWFTGFADADEIKVYFDDEATPRIDMPLADLFSGRRAPFAPPLVGDAGASSGGFFSYVPLTFAKSLRVTVTPDKGIYYNVDFHELPADATVATWTGNEDLSAARATWAAAGSDPRAGDPSGAVESTFDLAPAETRTLFDGDGPGELSALELRIPGLVPPPRVDGGADAGADAGASSTLGPMADVLSELWVEMSWDNESPPSVSAPLGSLFAQGDLGAGASGGLMAGLRADGTLYLYFPMPFAEHANVTITNRGATPLTGAWARVEQRAFPFAYDEVGTFAVEYHATVSVSGSDMPLLDTSGSGKVVGFVVSEMRQACSGCFIRDYLEGDERVLVDGARTPVVLGTGTEDFFNGGFYFDRGPFGLPTHGNVFHLATPSLDATSAYRFLVSDPIAFRSHVRLSLQHGPTDNDSVTASSLVYYYRQLRSRLVPSDALVVGDLAGESLHQYQTTDATWSGSLGATWEGEFSAQRLTATGRSQKGSTRFVMAIDPANAGVVLRRLLNQGTGNQRAQVFANGALVGDWLTPGANVNHAWREEDFAIPARMTAGASSLAIEIRFVSSDLDWTEFEYDAYSLIP